MKQPRNVIYGLWHSSGPGRIRYVGKTVKTATERLSAHLSSARCTTSPRPVLDWMRSHELEGFTADILEVIPLGDDMYSREIYWIEKLRTHVRHGAGGLNLTDGGPGANGPMPESQKKAISLSRIGKKKRIVGSPLGFHKLTPSEAREVKSLIWDGLGNTEIGKKFGVSPVAIQRLRDGESWDYIPWPDDRPRVAPKARLTPDQVLSIRASLASGVAVKDIAALYDMTENAIYHIRSGKAWAHVK